MSYILTFIFYLIVNRGFSTGPSSRAPAQVFIIFYNFFFMIFADDVFVRLHNLSRPPLPQRTSTRLRFTNFQDNQ